MVLTDQEIVINLAKNVDEETLALVNNAKFLEFVDDAIVKGKAAARAYAPAIDWTSSEALNHPAYELYKEIYQLYAANHLLLRLQTDYKDDVAGLMQTATDKGALLSKAVKELATYNQDSGISKIRSSASSSVNVTYPANLGLSPYHSPNFLNRRRGRV